MNDLIIYYSCSGNTRKAAEEIRKQTGADLHEILLERPYSTIGSYTRGIVDCLRKKLPQIKNDVDLTPYKRIYIGGPVWNYTVCPQLQAFIKEKDFSGKTVIPFCTDGGDKGDCFERMEELMKGADVQSGHEFINVSRINEDQFTADIHAWLNTIKSNKPKP